MKTVCFFCFKVYLQNNTWYNIPITMVTSNCFIIQLSQICFGFWVTQKSAGSRATYHRHALTFFTEQSKSSSILRKEIHDHLIRKIDNALVFSLTKSKTPDVNSPPPETNFLFWELNNVLFWMLPSTTYLTKKNISRRLFSFCFNAIPTQEIINDNFTWPSRTISQQITSPCFIIQYHR